MFFYALTFFVSFLATYLATPYIVKLATHFEAVDYPNERKIHTHPIPRWGGIALLVGILVSLLTAYFSQGFRSSLQGDSLKEFFGILGASFLMLVVGLIDDKKPLSAKTKLFWQIVSAVWLVALGVKISFISFPFSHRLYFFPKSIAFFVSLLWIVGITNALNLLDGLDGLLAGISTISSFALFSIAVQKGQAFPAFILIAMGGATLAFLRYNFNPASIFLGDSGSLFLGMLWASISISGALKTPATALFVPFLILGLPIADTFYAILRRFKKGESIFKPDKEHLHHRLLNRGWSQKKTVLILYLMGGALGVLAFFLNNWIK
jgi:UDP-GlcNAc:undecaprenyl-phosphate GlcNAc-1-phosphate transferase